MDLKLVTEAGDLKGRFVIIRSSCNVPLDGEAVRNAYRLKRAIPTLAYLKEAGAKVIVISHIGREATDSLKPVYAELSKLIPMKWGGKITDTDFVSIKDSMSDGDIVMCENLRQDPREEENDRGLVELIASYGDIYVNDAFAEAHREHASTYGVAKLLPAYAGLTLAEEVSKLSSVMNPEHPALFILGGAKFETKMPLVSKYLEMYEHVFIGGALTNDVLKARGFEVGQSLVSDVSLAGAPFLWSEKLLVPIDVVVEGPEGVLVRNVEEVKPEEKIFDAGPATIKMLEEYINNAKTILWNGPFGNYEKGFIEATEATAQLIAAASAYSVIGGGDTVAAVEKLGLNDQFGFVSIGGGSMLTLLEHGSTPVLDRLCRK